MNALVRVGICCAVFAHAGLAQGTVNVPEDVITVSGVAGVDATAEIVGHAIDNGGDIPAGTPIGHQRFEAEVPGLATSQRGKAHTYGPATAVDVARWYQKRGVLNYYMDVGGLGAWSRSSSAVGSAQFTFSPKPGYGVEGYFRARTAGRLSLAGTGTGSGSVTVTAPGLNLQKDSTDSAGAYFATGNAIVELPQTGTITQDLAGAAIGAGRARGKIATTLYFVPTKIWMWIPTPWGVIQGPIIYQ